jgi:hypothetical protein
LIWPPLSSFHRYTHKAEQLLRRPAAFGMQAQALARPNSKGEILVGRTSWQLTRLEGAIEALFQRSLESSR